MLIGQYETSISPKRRVAVPSKFRKILGKKLIIARFYEGCLVMVGASGWDKLVTRLGSKSQTVTASVRDTDRFILGSAFEAETDNQGRIIIPSVLANYASIKDKVIFIGLMDRVEIWDRDTWRRREKEIGEYAGYLLERIAKDHRS